MQLLTVKGLLRDSTILIGESVNNLSKYIPQDNVLIIADIKMKDLPGMHLPAYPTYFFRAQEKAKGFSTVADIYKWLLEQGADRSTFIVGIGGGIICDITGFVASTFMRGLRFGLMPTTLLSQVDASVGGKNGLNFDGFKNIIGTFNQPDWVLCDINILKTLPIEEFKSGMAEVIKHAIIFDADMLAVIEKHENLLSSFNPEVMQYLVKRSVEIKADIVSADELETGLRRKLNLGHTWGHAVESVTGIFHGYAVSIGLAFAAHFSVYKGYLSREEHDRIITLLDSLKLPTTINADLAPILNSLAHDKKKQKDSIHFVFISSIGEVKTELVSIDEIKTFAHEHYVKNLC